MVATLGRETLALGQARRLAEESEGFKMTSATEGSQPAGTHKTPKPILERMRAAYAASANKVKRRSRARYWRNQRQINAQARATRAANREKFRAREKSYRQRDRQVYNRRQRERHQARIPNVGKRALGLFRKDPHREERLGIRGYTICRECGAKLKTQIGGAWSHLWLVHHMTVEAYGTKWPGASLLSDAHRQTLSRNAKKGADLLRGRPRAGLKSVRGHKDEGPAKKWPIARLLVQGQSYSAIGRQLNRFFTTIASAGQQLGFSGKPCVRDFGEPFTAETVRGLKTALGLSTAQFARQVGVGEPVLAEVIWPARERQRIRPEVARKIIRWRDERIRDLLPVISRPQRGEDKFSGSRLLKTFFPNLRTIRKLVLQGFRQCRAFLNANPSAGVDGLGEHLCAQAMREVAENSHRRFFVRFLCLAAELKPFLEANLHRLQGSGDLWPLAHEAIGSRWGATTGVVAGAVRTRTRVIPPKEMRALIGALQLAPGSAKVRKRPGPRPREWGQTQRFQIGKDVEASRPVMEEGVAYKRSLPRRIRRNQKLLNQALSVRGYSQEQVEALANPGAKTGLVAARMLVAILRSSPEHRLEFETVARYHRAFRRMQARPASL